MQEDTKEEAGKGRLRVGREEQKKEGDSNNEDSVELPADRMKHPHPPCAPLLTRPSIRSLYPPTGSYTFPPGVLRTSVCAVSASHSKHNISITSIYRMLHTVHTHTCTNNKNTGVC